MEWSYLSRAIDRDDNLVDSLLSEAPNFEAVSCFFKQSFNIFCHTFWRVTKDGHDFYPRVIHKTLGNEVIHRYNRHLNNRLKQDQRGIKYRSYPVCMFGSVASYVVLGPQF